MERNRYDNKTIDPKQDPIGYANMEILKKIDQRDTYFEFIREYFMRRNNPYFDDKWAEVDIRAKKLIKEAG